MVPTPVQTEAGELTWPKSYSLLSGYLRAQTVLVEMSGAQAIVERCEVTGQLELVVPSLRLQRKRRRGVPPQS